MKKVIISIVSVILLALIGVLGFRQLNNNGPRGRVISPTGSKIIVEEMSYYIGGEKMFGKVFKPADANGNFPDSLGAMPLVVFFHEPLKTEWAENLIKSLVPLGVIGYSTGFRGSDKDAESLVKRLRKEKMIQEDMVFLACDSSCGNEIVKATTRLGHKIQGLILVEPSLTGKARETYVRYGREFLTINGSSKPNAASMIEDYLEERGALK
ncbi:MAG: hypothetical protein IJ840_09625 [Bacteroidales bacterium]|nr:hypothetical protein [Bacteroidales bacterium]